MILRIFPKKEFSKQMCILLAIDDDKDGEEEVLLCLIVFAACTYKLYICIKRIWLYIKLKTCHAYSLET